MSRFEDQEDFSENRKRGVSGKIAPLFGIASSAMVLAGLAITLVAKIYIFAGIQSDGSAVVDILRIGAQDLMFFFALTSAFLMLEFGMAKTRPLTIILAAIVLAFSIVNATYLVIAGAQVDFSAFVIGVQRFHEVWGIFKDSILQRPAFVAGLILVVFLAVYGFRRLKRLVTVPSNLFSSHVRLSIALSGSGAAIFLLTPAIENFSIRQIADNSVVGLVTSWKEYASHPESAASRRFQKFVPRDIVTPTSLEKFKGGRRPNIVLVIMESTRYDYVEAPDGVQGSPYRPRTPNLKRLATEGTWASRARAVVPHTTKSVFSILCARTPILHREEFESSTLFDSQCLPEILDKAGYKTAFLQTAIGAFEFRPRLVTTFGFRDFAAWENIGGEPLGYLASDDLSLARAFNDKLDAYGDNREPFFITVLTSAPHHPYHIPVRLLSDGETNGNLAAEERYARLIAVEDALVGEIVAALNRRGLRENTIIVAVGDHGEGFGAKGVKQHDNNFFEEGLRVPLIVTGPEIPRKRVDKNVSLNDVTPTLLALLGLEYALDRWDPLNGSNIYAPQLLPVPRYFFCYFESTCAGFVLGENKVVGVLNRQRLVHFDLEADPTELASKTLPPALMGMVPALIDRYVAMRFAPGRPSLIFKGRLQLESGWNCPQQEFCSHPNSPPGHFHSSPSIFR